MYSLSHWTLTMSYDGHSYQSSADMIQKGTFSTLLYSAYHSINGDIRWKDRNNGEWINWMFIFGSYRGEWSLCEAEGQYFWDFFLRKMMAEKKGIFATHLDTSYIEGSPAVHIMSKVVLFPFSSKPTYLGPADQSNTLLFKVPMEVLK